MAARKVRNFSFVFVILSRVMMNNLTTYNNRNYPRLTLAFYSIMQVNTIIHLFFFKFVHCYSRA